MPLNTSSKRRSSVGLLEPWQAAPPSPTDTPGVLSPADRQHVAGTYSGILAGVPPVVTLVWRMPNPIGMSMAASWGIAL